MSDPMAFKIPQVRSSVLAALRLYSQSFRILNAVESSVALSNNYMDFKIFEIGDLHITNVHII